MRYSSSCSRGFTLMEVLLAMAVLGLVATGALRLVIMSQATLREVTVQRRLLDASRNLILEAKKQSLSDQGEEDGLEWKLEKQSCPVPLLGELSFHELKITVEGRSLSVMIP